MQRRILVIGSGFGGLAAACRLAARGHRVDLYEKRAQTGGKAAAYEINGFKFDSGPTLLHMPFLFDELFSAGGQRREDYFDLSPLDPYYRVLDPSGRSISIHAAQDASLSQIHNLSPGDVAGYQSLLKASDTFYQTAAPWIENASSGNWASQLKHFPALLRTQAYRNVYQFISSYIQDEFLRQALAVHTPLLFGGNPFSASSLYLMMHAVERQWGVHYPLGGVGRVVQSLEELFSQLGGRLHLNTEVVEILTQGRRAVGVRLADGGQEYADRIIVNADAAHLYRDLLVRYNRRIYTDGRLDRMPYSMSQFIVYFGARQRYLDQGLQHHNILLMPRYRESWGNIFAGTGAIAYPMLYLHMPTFSDPSVAPEGHELFYAAIPVSNLDANIDWSKAERSLRDALIGHLEKNYLPGLHSNIVTEMVITPQDFKQQLNCDKGAAYGFQPLLTRSGWFRPHNRSRELENLYLVGSGTTPGSGVHNALISARNVEKLIQASI